MINISCINYTLGDSKPITEIPELAGDDEGAKFLLDRGFKNFRSYDGEPWQVGVDAAKKTLEEAKFSPADIDQVVYASISSKNPMIGDLGVGLFANAMNMLETPIAGVCFGECTNSMLGLEYATMLVETGRARNVLLVSTDVACSKEQRMTSGYTICSDGAAACIVSNERHGEGYSFELVKFQKAYHHLSRAGLSNPGQAFRDIAKAASFCKSTVTKEFTGKISKWIPNTGNTEVAGAFASVLGIPLKDYYLDNLADYAHLFSTDQLVNLIDWASRSNIADGEYGCGIATGLSGSCSALWRVRC
ncbi:3-oxoacyl-[acyl-carrier-protein] synthase III [Thalassolituus maritimus]|uniref:3-oxoacyl-[acyl-carrier-protein] synthase III n=1 Tax=Thalassolituus maritimus TaxID=484498 RepID=A0A1N7Q9B4_9GAMM|nr:hypothetical protein [Thalassolituus maritimus]SIT19421.1 3-oxoacyl-[acyl-carrier-protein] synthase III [Thalassolituus maritimus]